MVSVPTLEVNQLITCLDSERRVLTVNLPISCIYTFLNNNNNKMAQGAAKNKGKAKVSGGRAKTGTMRKGRIAIAPKVTQKVREAAHKKVCRVLYRIGMVG
jgi:ribosomal protein L4